MDDATTQGNNMELPIGDIGATSESTSSTQPDEEELEEHAEEDVQRTKRREPPIRIKKNHPVS